MEETKNMDEYEILQRKETQKNIELVKRLSEAHKESFEYKNA